MKKITPNWVRELVNFVHTNINRNSECRHVNWRAEKKDGWTDIYVAPAFEEVLGGKDDGTLVWPPLIFDIGVFLETTPFRLKEMAVASRCPTTTAAQLMIRGTFLRHRVLLHIELEVPEGSEPLDVIDTIRDEVRSKYPERD